MSDDLDPDAVLQMVEWADDDPDLLPARALVADEYVRCLRNWDAESTTIQTPWGNVRLPPRMTDAIRSGDDGFRHFMIRRFETYATVARRLLLERAAREPF